MLSFENDYSEGAHPRVLEALIRTNLTSQPGYGADEYSEDARRLIREACNAPGADVFFISGGTQTNALVTGGLLRSWEGVVSAGTGHVAVHEAGAVEFTGHKVIPLPQSSGKLEPQVLRRYLESFFSDQNRDHMVFPGMVYISHPTEYGTLYAPEELEELSSLCRQHNIPLYMDGARLAYALAADPRLTLPDIARLCDVFYIGGTKCGALCGEALVFPNGAPEHFTTVIKQRGALLAKGRLCGVQFRALFEDGLYLRLGKTAVDLALRLRDGLTSRGYKLLMDSPTNQQFPIVPDSLLPKLSEKVRFSFWEALGGGESAIRFAASWATKPEDVYELLEILDNLTASD